MRACTSTYKRNTLETSRQWTIIPTLLKLQYISIGIRIGILEFNSHKWKLNYPLKNFYSLPKRYTTGFDKILLNRLDSEWNFNFAAFWNLINWTQTFRIKYCSLTNLTSTIVHFDFISALGGQVSVSVNQCFYFACERLVYFKNFSTLPVVPVYIDIIHSNGIRM